MILVHNYMTPEIFHGVADFAGDSLQLAIEAGRVPQSVIVQCGVHFMAETAKILNPDKTVLIPDGRAGCSLAASITPEDVLALKKANPGAPVVTYVNTSAEVKAVSDICCTSSNALAIVEGLPQQTVIMTPDGFLAQNIAAQSSKHIVWVAGCLRGARTLHSRRDTGVPGRKSGDRGSGPSRMSSGGGRRSRFHRIHLTHDPVGSRQAT